MDCSVLEIDTKIDTTSEFGKYELGCRQKLARKLAAKTKSKPLINLLRQVGGLRSTKLADAKVYGHNFRLYPQSNRSDKIMLGMPHMFDAKERSFLAEHLNKVTSPAFLDVGANIGAYSAFVANLGVAKTIVALEADPEMYKRLSFNLPANVTKLNYAVSDAEGTIAFYIHEHNRGENSIVANNGRKIEVPAKTLQKLIEENFGAAPNAMKIDIEGAEYPVLNKFFADAPQNLWPEIILVEHIHSKDVVELLESKGYKKIFSTKLNAIMSRSAA